MHRYAITEGYIILDENSDPVNYFDTYDEAFDWIERQEAEDEAKFKKLNLQEATMKDCTMCNYEYRCDQSKNTNGDCPDYRPDIDALDEMEMKKHEQNTF